ncbi:MAG: type II toxin-antitoxin system RelB/DinJ family antitoxin [Bacilli bacterium]|nr:type II toxin-antitoxin system RelB/DinJ family antitoxin [Bacilli bacterium]
MTTVTFRVDETLKKKAAELFDSLGMNLSQAINMFLKQAVLEGRYPCCVDTDEDDFPGCSADILALFGSGADLDMPEIEDPILMPEDIDL